MAARIAKTFTRMVVDTLAIVGVGLMGGSVGLAAQRYGAARTRLGCGPDADDLERARLAGVIDAIVPLDVAAQADLVVVAVPVDVMAGVVRDLARLARPQTVITDVGSTKARIVAALADLPNFVGGHPLAGSEKHGADYAIASLFDRRLVVLTPTAATDPAAITLVTRLWKLLGARVTVLSSTVHDEIVAHVSHLPHAIAALLAGMLTDDLKPYAAGGFRDLTRVAAGSPSLWSAIFTQNKQPVLAAVDTLAHRLADFRNALASDDRPALETMLTRAKQVRDALGS